ncbi:MAG: DNA methyltransferase [Microgenomates group bacterium]
MNTTAHRYFFVLGNHPDLSFAEIEQMLPTHECTKERHVAQVLGEELNVDSLQALLGGTVKILKATFQCEDVDDDTLQRLLTDHLLTKEGKIIFGLAEHGRDHLPTLDAMAVKKALRKEKRSVRFIDGSRYGLSAAILCNEDDVIEVGVVQTSEGTWITETLTVQDINDWTKQDRHKPYADRKKGMLPPKLARMMVNIALGPNPAPDSLVLDPFCGSGTILMATATRNTDSIGSDLDLDAVIGSKKNLQWFKEEYGSNAHVEIFKQDATHLKLNTDTPISHIITEPFLGKPKPSARALSNIFKGLEKLYLGAFKHWTKHLKAGAKVVIVFPRVRETSDHPAYSLEKIVDKLRILGYTTESDPLHYARPDAIIERSIYQYTYQPTDK